MTLLWFPVEALCLVHRAGGGWKAVEAGSGCPVISWSTLWGHEFSCGTILPEVSAIIQSAHPLG